MFRAAVMAMLAMPTRAKEVRDCDKGERDYFPSAYPLFSLALTHMAHAVDPFTQPRQLILGGEQVSQSDKYPYFTQVEPDAIDRDHVCGGTLVAPDMVLSHPQCE